MDLLAHARDLQETLRRRSREVEEARRLPADLAHSLAGAGFFRMAVPKSCGGLEVDAATLFETLERLGEADAATAWCVMIGVTSAVVGAYLPLDTAREIFSDPATIIGGVYAPMGRAVRDGDHYRVSGRWQWASGSSNCAWLIGGCAVIEQGKPRLLPNGALDNHLMIFPATQATLIDTWFASGLCGSGSGDMEVNDIRVPLARSLSLLSDRPRERGPLYAFPVFGLLALGIAAVLLGNARGAVRDLIELAAAKKPQGTSKTLAERPTAQAALAAAEAQLCSARAFFYAAIADAWNTAANGKTVSIEQRAALRLAATHATRVSAAVARDMYDLGGGSSVHLAHPLQRRFRDAHTGTQHFMVAPATFELVGRVLMRVPTDPTQL